jgi:hypothetical protein
MHDWNMVVTVYGKFIKACRLLEMQWATRPNFQCVGDAGG